MDYCSLGAVDSIQPGSTRNRWTAGVVVGIPVSGHAWPCACPWSHTRLYCGQQQLPALKLERLGPFDRPISEVEELSLDKYEDVVPPQHLSK